MAEENPSTVLKSVKNLCDLSGALSEFVSQWDGLQRTLDSLVAAIDARSSEIDARRPPKPSPSASASASASASLKEEAADIVIGKDKSAAPDARLEPEPEAEPAPPAPHGGDGRSEPEQPPTTPHGVGSDARSELHSLCETMAAHRLRKFIAAHLSDVGWLRLEAPAALRRAPAPARLVLDALGRFYVQSRRAFSRHDSPAVAGRRACILLLEFLVVSGCSAAEAEPSVREDAKVAALAWRNRLLTEGGIQSTGAVDALGLVLFVGAFGIPDEFSCGDLYHLLRLSNLNKKAEVLQQSSILTEKIPDIIQGLLGKNMCVEAVDLICAMGLKEKIPPLPLLLSFLRNLYRRDGLLSSIPLKEANKKQLAVLKSVVRCLEDNNLDSSELASFHIDKTISKLEKKIAKGQKLKSRNLKRTADEVEPLKQPETQARRSWPASSEASPGFAPQLSRQTQEQRIAAQSDSRGLYTNVVSKNKLDVGYTGLQEGSSMGSPAVRIPVPTVGTSFTAAADAAGQALGNNVGSLANMSGASYGWYGDEAFNQRSAGRGMLEMHSSAGWMGPSPTAGQNFYQPRSSNLYQFADTVLEQEAYHNSRSVSAVPRPTNPGYYSSYKS